MASPTIVIVHAAAQPPALYQPLAQALQKQRLPVDIVDYPSVGDNVPKMQDNAGDLDAVRKTVSSLVEAGKDVIMLMHSYGGIPGTGALEGLGKAQREVDGKKGGVIRLVYAAAYALRTGEQVHVAGDLDAVKAYGKYFEDVSNPRSTLEDAQELKDH